LPCLHTTRSTGTYYISTSILQDKMTQIDKRVTNCPLHTNKYKLFIRWELVKNTIIELSFNIVYDWGWRFVTKKWKKFLKVHLSHRIARYFSLHGETSPLLLKPDTALRGPPLLSERKFSPLIGGVSRSDEGVSINKGSTRKCGGSVYIIIFSIHFSLSFISSSRK